MSVYSTQTIQYHHHNIARDTPLVSGVSNAGMVCTTQLRDTREREKREIGMLNDQLASYIEKVRFLTAQNHCLTHDIEFLRRGSGGKSHVSVHFDAEISNTSKLLQQIIATRVRYENEIPTLTSEIEVIRKKWLDSLNVVRAHREDHHIDLDKLAKIEAESSVYVRKIRIVDEDVHRVRRENDNIHRKLHELRGFVQSEIAMKHERSQSIQSLLQRISTAQSENSIHIKQEMVHIRRDTTVENRDYFRHELQAAMRDIRASYEALALRSRQEVEDWYRQQLTVINSNYGKFTGFEYKQEIESIRITLSSVKARLSEIEVNNRLLESRIADLTNEINSEAKISEIQLAERDAINAKIRHECEELSLQLAKLCDNEITLRAEIETYKALLGKANVSVYTQGNGVTSRIHSEITVGGNIGGYSSSRHEGYHHHELSYSSSTR